MIDFKGAHYSKDVFSTLFSFISAIEFLRKHGQTFEFQNLHVLRDLRGEIFRLDTSIRMKKPLPLSSSM